MIGIDDFRRHREGAERDRNDAAYVTDMLRRAYLTVQRDLWLQRAVQAVAGQAARAMVASEQWMAADPSPVDIGSQRFVRLDPTIDEWQERLDHATYGQNVVQEQLNEDLSAQTEAIDRLLAGAVLDVRARKDQLGFVAVNGPRSGLRVPRRLLGVFDHCDLQTGTMYVRADYDYVRAVPMFHVGNDGTISDLASLRAVTFAPPSYGVHAIAGSA